MDTDLSVSGYFCPILSNGIHLEPSYYYRTILECWLDRLSCASGHAKGAIVFERVSIELLHNIY